MKKIMLKHLLTMSLFLALGNLATAQETGVSAVKKTQEFSSRYQPHVGLLAGVTDPEGDRDSSSEMGVEVGIKANPLMDIGAEFSNSKIDNGVNDQTRNTLLLKAHYNLESDVIILKDSYVGLGAGAIFKSSETVAVAAPLIGFDIPVTSGSSDYMTLGAAARYAFIAEGEIDTFTLSGAVKYWY